jgi:hypothetical protein
VSARAFAVILLAAAVGCGEAKTGPDVPAAIEFPPPQLPAIVAGDQIRDTLGNIDALRAIIFNSFGDTIHDAGIRYLHADTTHVVQIDSITGQVMGLATGVARIVAQAGGLQSPVETLYVTQRPDQFATVTPATDTTLDFSPNPLLPDTLFPLTVSVTAAAVAVPRYRVEFHFVSPEGLDDADSTHILLTTENRKQSFVDTTGVGAEVAGGTATRYLRISPFAHPFTGTVVVEARAFLPDHTPIPGSPRQFTVHVQIH